MQRATPRVLRRRALTENDRAAWAGYVRLVMPLPGNTVPDMPEAPLPPPPPQPSPSVSPPPAVRLPPPVARAATLVVGTSPGGVDASTWNRFRTGRLPVSRTLDLHGRTAQRAHAALDSFLHTAIAEGLRCVEVITGRGSGENGGVIRREFPFWLNQPHLRPLILAATHPHALNPGSVRLLLRRSRG